MSVLPHPPTKHQGAFFLAVQDGHQSISRKHTAWALVVARELLWFLLEATSKKTYKDHQHSPTLSKHIYRKYCICKILYNYVRYCKILKPILSSNAVSSTARKAEQFTGAHGVTVIFFFWFFQTVVTKPMPTDPSLRTKITTFPDLT